MASRESRQTPGISQAVEERQSRKSVCELVREQKKQIAKNPEKFRAPKRDSARKSKYGISRDEFSALFSAQEDRCRICKCDLINPVTKRVRPLTENVARVDHCHVTGRVRGLLCNPCNLTLGWTRDSIDWLQSAIEYLSVDSHQPMLAGSEPRKRKWNQFFTARFARLRARPRLR